MEIKREYSITNIVKFAGACFVLAKHSFVSDAAGMYWVAGLVKGIVQMFFVLSGFFFIKSGAYREPERQKKYIKHLIYLILLWSAAFFIHDIPGADRSTETWMIDYAKMTTDTIGALNYGDLWYVENLLVVIALLICLRKFAFSLREIVFWVCLTAFLPGNFLRALTAVAFGLFLAKEKSEQEQKCMPYLGVFGGCCLVLLIVLYELLEFGFTAVWAAYAVNFLANVSGFFLAGMAVYLDERRCAKERREVNTFYLRKMSTLIYFLHLLIVPSVYSFTAHYLPRITALGGNSIVWSGTIAGITFVITFALSAIILLLANRKPFRWLRNLY